MAQHDYVIANGTGAAVRSDINNGLAAIVSNNSGASAPATTYAYMLWADTSTNLLKLRNGANSAWITVGDLTAANLGLAALASPTFTGTVTIPTATISTGVGIPLGSAASPAIYFTGDTNTGIYSPGADQVAISTGGTGAVYFRNGKLGVGESNPSGLIEWRNTSTGRLEADSTSVSLNAASNVSLIFKTNDVQRAVLDTSGRLGIGNTAPGNINSNTDDLVIGAGSGDRGITLYTGSTSAGYLAFNDTGNTTNQGWFGYSHTDNALLFGANSSERARIDSSGRLLVGTSSNNSTFDSAVQIAGNASAATQLISAFNNNTNGGELYLTKSRSGTVGTNTVVQSGDRVGFIGFYGADGTTYQPCAQIAAIVDGTPGSADMPGRLVFSTTADGASSPTERLRITSAGQVRLAGAGITFNGDTAAANELDDYEEGTFTPTIVGTTDAGTGTYTVQVGVYTKVGTIVHFAATILWTAHTGTGNMRVGGLPFTCDNTANYNPACALDNNNLTTPAGTYPTAVLLSNTTQIGLSSVPTGGGSRASLALDTAATIWVSGSYSV
jgi:hypothetical protein